MNKVNRYFKGVVEEGKRVRWPKKKVLWSAVGIVIGITLFCAICLFVEDLISASLMSELEKVFNTDSSTTAQIVINKLGGLF